MASPLRKSSYKSAYNSCITQETLIALAGRWVWGKWQLPPPCLVPCKCHHPWSYDLGTRLLVRRPHIYCIWHATHLYEDAQRPTLCTTCVQQNYARRSISHQYILYKNAQNQAQTAYSYAVRNDSGHYGVQMAWLAIKMSHSGSWMQSSLHQLLPWRSNDTHHVNWLWWSELPLASRWRAHQFVARATNWQLSKHSAYGSWHTFGGQLPLFWQWKVLGYHMEKMMEQCSHSQPGF